MHRHIFQEVEHQLIGCGTVDIEITARLQQRHRKAISRDACSM